MFQLPLQFPITTTTDRYPLVRCVVVVFQEERRIRSSISSRFGEKYPENEIVVIYAGPRWHRRVQVLLPKRRANCYRFIGASAMGPVDVCCVVLLLAAPVFAINCFQCSSYKNPECADIEVNDTKSPFLHKCEERNGHRMFCRKIVQKVLDDPTFHRITRTCGWYAYKSNSSFCQVTDTDFKLETTCQCFTDACNTGSAVTAPVAAALTAVFVGLLMR
ncbi:hypothetical protein Zmor_024673 [Zophobas morio]|uniref:Protein sleepless n=1 Tax=Zophobas morio TaxID=2755281 RepID=A0AA38M8S7_9CUCU|nr:hypothetical protein Zmor_024673 [Zophobas morio]